jgi:D-methionine transport system permease protein
VHGQVDEIQGKPFGSLAVFARGAREQLNAAVAHLRGAGVVSMKSARFDREAWPMFSNFSQALLELFVSSLWETIVMVGISGLVGALIGIPLGVFLRLTDEGGVLQQCGRQPRGGRHRQCGALHAFHHPAGGHHSADALHHRLVHRHGRRRGAAHHRGRALHRAAGGNLAARSGPRPDRSGAGHGRDHRQIVFKVLLPEALPGIVAGLTITFVSLTGYSAMAGAIGGGGLGDLGIRYGYQRFLPEVMLAVVLVLILFVQAVQSLGDWAGAPVEPQ